MFVNCIHLYMADTVDFIDTFVPALWLYSTTAHICINHTRAQVLAKEARNNLIS